MRHFFGNFKHLLTFFSIVALYFSLIYWHLLKICILTFFLQVWDLPTLWPPVLWACTTTWLLHGPSTTFSLLSLPSYHGIHAKTLLTHHVRVNFTVCQKIIKNHYYFFFFLIFMSKFSLKIMISRFGAKKKARFARIWVKWIFQSS